MALTFRGSEVHGSGSTSHEFGPFVIGPAAAGRRVIIGFVVSGSNAYPTVTVGGVTASHVASEPRTANRVGIYIAIVPTGETATVVVTHGSSVIAGVGVWTATGMTSSATLETEDFTMTTSSAANEVMTTADGGIALAVQFRSSGSPGWNGVTGQFNNNLGGFQFCGAHTAPTVAPSLTVGVGVIVNIASAWAAATWATGGEPDPLTPPTPAEISIGAPDRNPAHIILECLTNKDWGMGGAMSSLDLVAFESAAITLWYERFGLSLQWVQQADIQTFVGEILDHIEATLFLHPRTGLLTLKLIRNDYDVATLPVITPDNATLSNWDRKGHGEIVNEVIVSWTNPDSEESETVYAQDLASISVQGLISDSRNYYGVRYNGLANRLAYRDLRAANAPLAICEAVLDRTQWDIVPGDVVKLTWPEYGIDQLVMRVGPVDYGKPGDPAIKVSLAEDVFGLDQGEFSAPPNSEWDDPREEASPIDYYELLTLPYWTVAQVLGASSAAAAVYPASAAGVLAAEGGSDTSSYDLMTEVTDATGAVGFETVATRSILSRLEIAGALAAEATSVVALAGDATQGAGPEVAGLVFIGAGGDVATEIAMVTAVGASDMTVLRGVLDTVPRAWPALTPVWFVNANMPWYDPSERSAFETANYKILPRTSTGPLPEAGAATVSFAVGERPHLPSRPANVKVNGTGWGLVDSIATNPATVTVAQRNRLTEDSQILAWTDATVTPESGQTWTIKLLNLVDRSVIATVAGLTGTSTTIAHSVFAGNSAAILRVTAARDGFESLQGHEITVVVSGLTADTDLFTADTDELTADHG